MPGILPDLQYCQCRMDVYYLPVLDVNHNFVTGLCNGVRLGVKAMAGFPSFKTLEHTGRVDFHGVKVFQSESKYT